MALKRQHGVFPAHPAAVIGHADQILAAFVQLHENTPRPGIQRVLHQLFDRRSGPLHDFARRDLVGRVLI